MDNNKIVEALRNVKDPSSGMDIISQRVVSDLKIKDNLVSFKLALNESDPKVKQSLYQACVLAIQNIYPDVDVDVHMDTQLKGNDKKSATLPQVKNIIAVASGKGGVGKSTVSLNLAGGLKERGYKVGLLDADLYGPSIPKMLGIESEKPKINTVHGKHKLVPIEVDGLYTISIGNIVDPEQAIVLRGPRLGGIIKQFVYDCLWPELDFLIIDLPPGTGDIQLTMVQTLSVTGAVMVTTPQDVAFADALKAANMFAIPNVNVPIIGIVENMSWFTPTEMPDKKYYLFGSGGGEKLAKYTKSMLLSQIPLVESAGRKADKGEGHFAQIAEMRSPFNKLYDNFLRQLALRNEMLPPTEKVSMI